MKEIESKYASLRFENRELYDRYIEKFTNHPVLFSKFIQKVKHNLYCKKFITLSYDVEKRYYISNQPFSNLLIKEYYIDDIASNSKFLSFEDREYYIRKLAGYGIKLYNLRSKY